MYIQYLETLQHGRERGAAAAAADISSNHCNGTAANPVARSMKHGGCINTVSWLDGGWRISTGASYSSYVAVCPLAPNKCLTQLLTSGDDHRQVLGRVPLHGQRLPPVGALTWC